MANPGLSDDEYLMALNALEAENGNKSAAARRLGLNRKTFTNRLQVARELFPSGKPTEFDPVTLPSELPTVEDLLDRREEDFKRKAVAEEARRLIDVKINIDGPVGIVHMGDPHVDDNGCDIPTLRKHVDIIQKTPGMLGANLGDLQNAWIGRLGRLYGQQGTSEQEAWLLVEWLVSSINWLYLIKGNHDCWTGSGDPLDWMRKHAAGVTEAHGARLNLRFPNGKSIRCNARHDFHGHSMWNPTHGPAKAVQMGWRDHILTAGHKHVSGYQILKCPSSGLISHAIRCAGYKVYDRYAKELGLPNQNVSPAVCTIIDPSREDNDPALVSVFWDIEVAAKFLNYLRSS